jgi:adhesin transport system outer membrane protein
VHAGYDAQYNLGMRSLLDLLDSQQELFTSQTRLATAQEVAVFGAYRILTLDGMLLSSLNVQPPPESDPQKAAARPAPPTQSK